MSRRSERKDFKRLQAKHVRELQGCIALDIEPDPSTPASEALQRFRENGAAGLQLAQQGLLRQWLREEGRILLEAMQNDRDRSVDLAVDVSPGPSADAVDMLLRAVCPSERLDEEQRQQIQRCMGLGVLPDNPSLAYEALYTYRKTPDEMTDAQVDVLQEWLAKQDYEAMADLERECLDLRANFYERGELCTDMPAQRRHLFVEVAQEERTVDEGCDALTVGMSELVLARLFEKVIVADGMAITRDQQEQWRPFMQALISAKAPFAGEDFDDVRAALKAGEAGAEKNDPLYGRCNDLYKLGSRMQRLHGLSANMKARLFAKLDLAQRRPIIEKHLPNLLVMFRKKPLGNKRKAVMTSAVRENKNALCNRHVPLRDLAEAWEQVAVRVMAARPDQIMASRDVRKAATAGILADDVHGRHSSFDRSAVTRLVQLAYAERLRGTRALSSVRMSRIVAALGAQQNMPKPRPIVADVSPVEGAAVGTPSVVASVPSPTTVSVASSDVADVSPVEGAAVGTPSVPSPATASVVSSDVGSPRASSPSWMVAAVDAAQSDQSQVEAKGDDGFVVPGPELGEPTQEMKDIARHFQLELDVVQKAWSVLEMDQQQFLRHYSKQLRLLEAQQESLRLRGIGGEAGSKDQCVMAELGEMQREAWQAGGNLIRAVAALPAAGPDQAATQLRACFAECAGKLAQLQGKSFKKPGCVQSMNPTPHQVMRAVSVREFCGTRRRGGLRALAQGVMQFLANAGATLLQLPLLGIGVKRMWQGKSYSLSGDSVLTAKGNTASGRVVNGLFALHGQAQRLAEGKSLQPARRPRRRPEASTRYCMPVMARGQ